MNRYLSIPLVLTLVVFATVYMSRSSHAEPTISPSPVASTAVNNAKNSKIKPISFEDVKIRILDGWPTLGESHFGSRRMIIEPLYATMGPIAQADENGKPNPDAEEYFCSLVVNAMPTQSKGPNSWDENLAAIHGFSNSGSYAIHIDRYTKEMKVFADGQWQEYQAWKKIALPKYIKATGWNNSENRAKSIQVGRSGGNNTSKDVVKILDTLINTAGKK